MSDEREDVWPEDWTLVRVYRLPIKLTDGYCFGDGVPITMMNVDWFETPTSKGRRFLTDYIQTKNYYRPLSRYLVIGDHPDFVFIMESTNV